MYTSDEINQAVEKLVRGSIRRELDPLGTRRTDLTFSDIQEAAAGVLLLEPTSAFYCLALGAQRLRDALQTEAALLDQLLEAILATGRRVLPIDSVDSLFAAKAALEELETAAASKVRDITKAPSYQRFVSNLDTFLAGPGQSVKSQGRVVPTPEGARQVIPSLLRELSETHEGLAERVRTLSLGMSDFARLNLPSLVARGAIARARQVIGVHADAMDGQSPADRLLSVRDVTLDVLAAKVVVTEFGSFSGPSEFYDVTGTAEPYADQSHPALPAQVESAVEDVVTLMGASLALTVDAAPITIPLDDSKLARVVSSGVEGWLIGDGTNPTPGPDQQTPNNNELRIRVGASTFTVNLGLSAYFAERRSADQVASDINAVLPVNVRAKAVFAPVEYSGLLDIAADGTMTVPGGASDLVALGVDVGHLVHVITGPFAGVYPLIAVTPTSVTVGVYFGSPHIGASVEIGSARKVSIACIDPAQATAEVSLSILGDTVKSANACTTLGFFPGLTSTSKPTTVDELVEQVTGRTSAVTASSWFRETDAGEATTSLTNAYLLEFIEPVLASRWMTVRIDEGPNRGDYPVESQPSPLQVLLQVALPVTRQGTLPLSFAASVGHKTLLLSGTTKTIESTLGASGAPLFPAPVLAHATTSYVKLEIPRGLSVGDVLELYESSYKVPDQAFEIIGVESSGVITLTPPIAAERSWQLAKQTPPIAKLRHSKTADFTTFAARLTTWLARPENQPGYFTALAATVNPLLVNQNPTGVQVGTAKSALLGLYRWLTRAQASTAAEALEDALAGYVVSPVGAVDTLVRTYKEKGADRAIDLLLSGDFRTFFSLTSDEASYAGSLQSAMRDVARQDVAIRRTSRTEASEPRQVSEAVSPDYDFESSDIEQGGQVDPPQQ